jgi:ribosomal protein L40E
MAKETLGYIRMVWVCPNCQNKNPGNFRFCRGCGAPQPADVKFEQDANAQLLTDPKEIELAAAGADIHCGYCGARNPAANKQCSACGADLASGNRRETGTVVGAFAATTTVPEASCPNCGTPNPADAMQCKACGAALRVHAPAAAAAPAGPRKFPWLVAVLIGGALCAIIGLVMLLSRTSDVQAAVANRTWERVVSIQALQPVQRQDWRAEIPAGVEPRSCEQRLYTTADQPQGETSVKVCGTPYSVDQGNGFAEVVQDCQYEIYQDYCSYTVEEWQQVDQIVSQGSEQRPSWPVVSLAQGQREGEREEVYTILFQTADGTKSFRTTDARIFETAVPGSNWTLVINSFGDIVDIQPAQ